MAAYQKTNDTTLVSSSWLGDISLDRSVKKDCFESLRHWLMSLHSIVEKRRRNGTSYRDKLFTSIHRSIDMQEVRFYFYRANEKEAINVISALPLLVRDELGVDPGCFFHKTDYIGVIEGEWNSATHIYKNKQTINQEQYLEDLDDCFMANKEFLPEIVILDQTTVDANVEKAMAMANGEDDVSLLSQLTDKTLKEATARRGKSSPSTQSLQSQNSGNTSKSKTQAAVKEALKEVSMEHNKAMQEQQAKFQREIENLRKALERQSTMSSVPNTEKPPVQEVLTNAETQIEIESSDDEASLKETQMVELPSPARSAKSPAKKRPKRGRGGRSSSTRKLNE
jgi:hypothetical protein